MRKSYFLAAAAVVAMVGCTNEDYFGVTENAKSSNVIGFGSQKKTVTRADLTGADAAAVLNNNFIVEGYKTTGTPSADYANAVEVFKYYNVNYFDGTAHSTESNSSDWEYVGQTPVVAADVFTSTLTPIAAQTIKYWDFDYDQYDFVAFSQGTGTGDPATFAKFSTVDKAKLGAAVKNDGTDAVYTVSGTAKQLGSAYIADLVTTYKNDYLTTVVTPKFRRLAAKVRIAMYETVPGYSVTDVRFYTDGTTPKYGKNDVSGTGTELSTNKPNLFAADEIFLDPAKEGTMSVYFPTVGKDNVDDKDYNQAHIVSKFADTDAGTNLNFNVLNYTANAETAETASTIYLGRSSADATYAGIKNQKDAAGDYVDVIPTGNGEALNLRVAYTLVPTDGGEEIIVVSEAKAVVPAEFTNWQPNFAYTYIFKITENSGTGDDCLYPITFDAVVMNEEDGLQETITKIGEPAITTYQNGKNVTENDEYINGKNIYAMVGEGQTMQQSDFYLPGFVDLYTVTVEDGALQPISEATVENCFFNGTASGSNIVVTDAAGRKLTLTTATGKLSIPGSIPADEAPHGVEITKANAIAKITAPEAKIYAFQYLTTQATYLPAVGTTVMAGTKFYTVETKGDVTYITETASALGNEKTSEKIYSVAPALETAATGNTLCKGTQYLQKSGDNYTVIVANGNETWADDTYYIGTPTRYAAGAVIAASSNYYEKVGDTYTKKTASAAITVQPTDKFYIYNDFDPTEVAETDCTTLTAGATYYKMSGTNIVKFVAKGNESITGMYTAKTDGTVYTEDTNYKQTLTAGETYYTFATPTDPTTEPTGAAAVGNEVIASGNYYTLTTPAKYVWKVIRVNQ